MIGVFPCFFSFFFFPSSLRLYVLPPSNSLPSFLPLSSFILYSFFSSFLPLFILFSFFTPFFFYISFFLPPLIFSLPSCFLHSLPSYSFLLFIQHLLIRHYGLGLLNIQENFISLEKYSKKLAVNF